MVQSIFSRAEQLVNIAVKLHALSEREGAKAKTFFVLKFPDAECHDSFIDISLDDEKQSGHKTQAAMAVELEARMEHDIIPGTAQPVIRLAVQSEEEARFLHWILNDAEVFGVEIDPARTQISFPDGNAREAFKIKYIQPSDPRRSIATQFTEASEAESGKPSLVIDACNVNNIILIGQRYELSDELMGLQARL